MSKFHIKAKDEQPNYKAVFPTAQNIIEYAFSVDDVDFFEFADFHEIPCDRSFASLAIFTELESRCTREYLKAFCKAFKDTVNAPTIVMTDLMRLQIQLEERLDFVFEHEIGYKLCSVVFFSADEDPYRYNDKISHRNAQMFRAAPIDSFFLSEPMSKYVGSAASSIEDFQDYSRTLTEMNKQHLSVISKMISERLQNLDYSHIFQSLNILVAQSTTSKE